MHPRNQSRHCHRGVQIFVKSPIHHQNLTLNLDPTQSITLSRLDSLLSSQNQGSFSDSTFVLNGKPLDGGTRLPVCDLAPFSTVVLFPRLRGGGGDGGATGAESRDCYLKMYAEKKPDKVDPNEQRLSKWLNCALSNEPLAEPCVIDRLGNLFNKEALVQALLSKRLPKQFSHVKGLKDMVNIKLTPIPGSEDDTRGDSARFQCPVSGLEFNGKYKFFALRGCGHVLSAKALKEVKSSSCLVCHEEFSDSDKIVINGTEEEVAVLREKMDVEKTRLKEKKGALRKGRNGGVAVAGLKGGDEGRLEPSRVSGAKRGADAKEKVDKAEAKLQGNVKVENGNGRNGGNGVPVKKFRAADMAPANATKEVYASIFTSSKKSDFKETFSCRSLPLGRN